MLFPRANKRLWQKDIATLCFMARLWPVVPYSWLQGAMSDCLIQKCCFIKCQFWTEVETKVRLCQLAASPHLLVWKAKKGPFLLFNSDIFFFSNSIEFHLIPFSSHSTEKHSQLLLACIGCQTADWLDYTGLYCIPAGTSHTKCFLGDQGSLLACTSTPGAVLNLEIPRQQAVLHMLLSKHSLLSLSKYKPAPNQLPKQPKLMVNLYSLWLSLLQQRHPVFCLLPRYWKLKPLQSCWQLVRSFSFISTISSYLRQSCILKTFKWPQLSSVQ